MGTNYYALNTCMVFFYKFQKLKLHASPNNNIVCCTTRDSSQQDLYKMLSDSHLTVIVQSSTVIGQSSGSHQAVIRQSSGSHQTVKLS